MADDQAPPPAPAPKRRRPGRKKGSPKTGGRKKGTPNRNSARFLEALNAANFPLLEMLLADISCLDLEDRIAQYKSLLRFCYPKLKSVEHLTPPLPPSAAPAATALPPTKPADRLALIRGKTPTKSGEPG